MPSSKDQSKAQPKGPSQINETSKKGKTLGANHSSHGDAGAAKKDASGSSTKKGD
jgi:hypothetical protein